MNIEKNKVLKIQNPRCPSITSVSLRAVFCILSSALCILPVGCNHGSNRKMLLDRIERLSNQNSELEQKIDQTESEKEQLKEQVRTLSGLSEEVRLSNLNQVKTVKIGSLTNLYDTDNDGKYDSLIVYIQPVDEYGDRIKVSGSVDVQLWDLNKPEDQSLIGQWHADPEMLKKHWVELLVINFRLTFELNEQIESYSEPLTVKIKFTDYMTGRIFNEQKIIKPKTP